MPPKTDNHKIYDDELQKAELGNKKAIDKDTLTDKEAQLSDKQSQASSGFTQYIDNAKVFLRKNPKKSAGLGFGLFGVLSAVYLSIISLGPLQFINMAEMLQNFNFSDQEISTSHRIRNLYNYSQLARGADGKLENTRLGTIESSLAKKIDRKLAKSGMTMEYSRPGGKFQGVNIDLDNMSDEMKNELKGAKTDDERNKAIAKMFDIDIGSVERNGNVIHIRAEGMKNSRTRDMDFKEKTAASAAIAGATDDQATFTLPNGEQQTIRVNDAMRRTAGKYLAEGGSVDEVRAVVANQRAAGNDSVASRITEDNVGSLLKTAPDLYGKNADDLGHVDFASVKPGTLRNYAAQVSEWQRQAEDHEANGRFAERDVLLNKVAGVSHQADKALNDKELNITSAMRSTLTAIKDVDVGRIDQVVGNNDFAGRDMTDPNSGASNKHFSGQTADEVVKASARHP